MIEGDVPDGSEAVSQRLADNQGLRQDHECPKIPQGSVQVGC